MTMTSGVGRLGRTVWPGPGDALLAGGLLAFAVAELWGLANVAREVAVPAAVGMTLPLLWRRRFPMVVAVVVLASFVGQTLLGVPVNAQLASLVAVVAAVYSMGAHASLRRGAVGLVVALLLAGSTVPANPDWVASDVGFIVVVLGGAWGLGRLVGARTAQAQEHERQAAAAVASSEERARRAIEDERRRIARELHDIISHGLSLMVVQAGAAEQVVTTDPDRVADSLRTIQHTGREALADMKHLLGFLRAPEAEDRLHPQPSLSDVGVLVDQTRQVGVPVELTVHGTPRPVGAGVELSAYRIVQEALTNVMKHAPAADVQVTIQYGDEELELEVLDDGHPPRRPTAGAGRGLVNMRERAELFGGELAAGPLPEGGHRVRARFPIAPVAAVP